MDNGGLCVMTVSRHLKQIKPVFLSTILTELSAMPLDDSLPVQVTCQFSAGLFQLCNFFKMRTSIVKSGMHLHVCELW